MSAVTRSEPWRSSPWTSEFRQGRYRGTPVTPEIEDDSDRIFQRFEFGCVTFSWSA